jgi:hypothetical protein
MEKKDVLRQIEFGQRIAEEEGAANAAGKEIHHFYIVTP